MKAILLKKVDHFLRYEREISGINFEKQKNHANLVID